MYFEENNKKYLATKSLTDSLVRSRGLINDENLKVAVDDLEKILA